MGKILVAKDMVCLIEETYILEERKRSHCQISNKRRCTSVAIERGGMFIYI